MHQQSPSGAHVIGAPQRAQTVVSGAAATSRL